MSPGTSNIMLAATQSSNWREQQYYRRYTRTPSVWHKAGNGNNDSGMGENLHAIIESITTE